MQHYRTGDRRTVHSTLKVSHMTTTQQEKSSPDYRKRLEATWSPEFLDNIVGLMRQTANEEIDKRIGSIQDILESLQEQHRQTAVIAAGMDKDDKSEVKPEVNAAGVKLREATTEADALAARQAAGEPVTEADVDKTAQHTTEAAQAVVEAQQVVAQKAPAKTATESQDVAQSRVARMEERAPEGRTSSQDLDRTEQELTQRRNRPQGDLDPRYVSRDEFNRVIGPVDQFRQGVKDMSDTKLIAITAYQWIENNYRTMRSSGIATILTFVGFIVLGWAVTATMDFDANWWLIVSMAAIVGGVVGALVWATANRDGVPKKSSRRYIDNLISAHYDQQEREQQAARERVQADQKSTQAVYPGTPANAHQH